LDFIFSFQLAGLTLMICEQRLVPGSLRGFDHEMVMISPTSSKQGSASEIEKQLHSEHLEKLCDPDHRRRSLSADRLEKSHDSGVRHNHSLPFLPLKVSSIAIRDLAGLGY
jgi:hypothetical protein